MNPLTSSTSLAEAIRGLQARASDPRLLLAALNDAYLQAYLDSDPLAFDALLAEDFLATLTDGRLVNRRRFLELVAQPHGVSDHRIEDVRVRVYGESGIVTAVSLFTMSDGTRGETRYTDVYVVEGGRWVAASAQITRVRGPWRVTGRGQRGGAVPSGG